MKSIDVVYVLGNGSRWHDNELRYSLRSIEKYLTGLKNIFVVGERPAFLNDIIHIPLKDEPGSPWKERNIMRKISAACADERLSKKFLFINDDHFLLQRCAASRYPYYAKPEGLELAATKAINQNYLRSIRNTVKVLNEWGLPTGHYDIHTPIVYDKDKFRTVMGQFDWNIEYGYVIKSLYANCTGVCPVILRDRKLDAPLEKYVIAEKIKGRPVFSVGDRALNDAMKQTLKELYPEPSRWERAFRNKIEAWLAEGTYDDGVEIFRQCGKDLYLMDLFSRGANPYSEGKLRHRLTKLMG